jgi:CheY-like chemotaxis protein
MTQNVLIIDDIAEQASNLSKALKKELPNVNFTAVSEEEKILDFIESKFYNLAIVDLRMDKFSFNGIELIEKIIRVNPFAKVVILSAFAPEYFQQIKSVLLTGKILDILDKESYEILIPKLRNKIEAYYGTIAENPSEINNALLQFYAEAKNEPDTFNKGKKFEHFVSLLFSSFGYKEIKQRVIDKSLNEVDLIVRNEIDDTFLNKFGKYILIECKNKPKEGVSKNDFIIFEKKLESTNGLSELGLLITSGYISKNTYIEAVRTSKSKHKIIFLSNPEIERIITSNDKKSEFKAIIDEQVKDN